MMGKSKPEPIYLTTSAAKVMVVESLRCDVETGGLLFGYPRSRVIDHATGPGPNAQMQACSFSPDVEFQRRALQGISRESCGRRKQMGTWHRHPGLMNRPSAGDQAQARQIAADFEHDRLACPFVALITIVDRRWDKARVLCRAHVFSSSSGQLEEAAFVRVQDDARLVVKARENEPPTLLTRKADLFNDLDFHFQETVLGRERLALEMWALESEGFKASIARGKKNGRVFLLIAGGTGRKLMVAPPMEYPLNPPRIFLLPEGSEWHGDSSIPLTRWNSDWRIVDLVRDWLAPQNELRRLT